LSLPFHSLKDILSDGIFMKSIIRKYRCAVKRLRQFFLDSRRHIVNAPENQFLLIFSRRL